MEYMEYMEYINQVDNSISINDINTNDATSSASLVCRPDATAEPC